MSSSSNKIQSLQRIRHRYSPWRLTARGLSLFGAAPIKLQISFLFLQAADSGGRIDPDEKASV
jgi:hypothetical protein